MITLYKAGETVIYNGRTFTIETVNNDGTLNLVAEFIPFMPVHCIGINAGDVVKIKKH